jgi:hypothetical protein
MNPRVFWSGDSRAIPAPPCNNPQTTWAQIIAEPLDGNMNAGRCAVTMGQKPRTALQACMSWEWQPTTFARPGAKTDREIELQKLTKTDVRMRVSTGHQRAEHLAARTPSVRAETQWWAARRLIEKMRLEARTNTRISCRRETTQNRTKEKLNGPLYWQAGITTVERSVPETATRALRSARHKSLQAIRAQRGKPARKGGKGIYLETRLLHTCTKTIERRLGKTLRQENQHHNSERRTGRQIHVQEPLALRT